MTCPAAVLSLRFKLPTFCKMEASICRSDEITILGGGNSADQVAVLTGFVRPVYLLIRRLSATRMKQQH